MTSRLLYISPVIPALTGNGLAMRAGMVVRALATRYRVSLLVVSLYPSPTSALPPEISECCEQVAIESPDRLVQGRPSPTSPRRVGWIGRVRRSRQRVTSAGATPPSFGDQPFDVVHVFRLAVLPYADAWLAPSGSPPQFHLDLDDIESKTLRRLAALRRLNGAITIAERDEEQAARMATRETAALDRCNRIYVCSTLDQGFLHGRGRADVYVLPNALPIPPTLPPPDESLAFTLLFVGTLGYYPNEDAALHFCRDVLPLIRREATRPFRVAIVGPGASPAVQRLGEAPEVRVIGAAPDLLPWYRDASAVVIPLRAGGGTRIKVLEAFSFRRPVVSTTIGVEGIEARHGEHALISDTPEMFARHCLRLMDDPMIADKLTARAFALFKDAYSTEAVTRMVAALPPP